MTVLGSYSVTLEVPDVRAGLDFYRKAGFEADERDDRAYIRCPGQNHESILLLGGAPRKRLHHLTLRADPSGFAQIRENAASRGGAVVPAPIGFNDHSMWVADPHGMLVELIDVPPDAPPEAQGSFVINEPGRTPRVRTSAVLPKAKLPPVQPLKLGHVLLFTPDVGASVDFFTEVLGMGLADRAQDIIAFCCARKNSDHHVVAFAKSPGVGFHHASFMVPSPDEVGRGGALLADAGARGNWGFGRHTIGSNFFHYIQDPWGSWFEYYSDMDFIDDYALWTPTNYEMEDSLASWGPPVPSDFVHNYEVEATPFAPARVADLVAA